MSLFDPDDSVSSALSQMEQSEYDLSKLPCCELCSDHIYPDELILPHPVNGRICHAECYVEWFATPFQPEDEG